LSVRIRVFHCEDQQELNGECFTSEVYDVSSQGMRITSGIELPRGTQVNVAGHLKRHSAAHFMLFGTVCWEFKEGGLLVKGLRFEDSENSDFSRWVAAIESIYWHE